MSSRTCQNLLCDARRTGATVFRSRVRGSFEWGVSQQRTKGTGRLSWGSEGNARRLSPWVHVSVPMEIRATFWNMELEYLEHHHHFFLPQFKSVWYKNHFQYFHLIVSFCFEFLFSFIKSYWLQGYMSINSLILEKSALIPTLTVTSVEMVPFVQGTKIHISILDIFITFRW